MVKRTLWGLVLTLGLLGFGQRMVFALTGTDLLLQKGLEARNQENYPLAFQCFKLAAEAGNAKAQYDLGYCYLTAQGTVHDDAEGVNWFQKSADQGYPQGTYSLGSCYENGWGVTADPAKAKECYQKAAQQGFIGGQTALQRLNGGPSTDSGQSAEPPASSAAPGGAGEGADWVTQGKAAMDKGNYPEAISLFQKAAGAGNIDGELLLGGCYLTGVGVPRDPSSGAKWIRKAAETGNASGQGLLGALYQKGEGVKRDPREAVKWFQKAADQSEPISETALGYCFLKGEGVKKDTKKAKEFFQKAASQGNEEAQKALTQMGG